MGETVDPGMNLLYLKQKLIHSKAHLEDEEFVKDTFASTKKQDGKQKRGLEKEKQGIRRRRKLDSGFEEETRHKEEKEFRFRVEEETRHIAEEEARLKAAKEAKILEARRRTKVKARLRVENEARSIAEEEADSRLRRKQSSGGKVHGGRIKGK
ncbi:hypothetical protein TNCV_4929621 [Trichonephila clavipes]|nr:hypothetical protein TNCV_4929621 [Trichonephila clavipes]